MRPNASEQLEGLGRILATVVAPEVHDPYPADILAGVIAALGNLGSGWYELPRYLAWDIGSSTEVLSAALPGLDGDVAQAVSQVLVEDEPDSFDLVELEARHDRVRAALALAAPVILADDHFAGVRALMMELFRERARRFPFALAPRTAAPANPVATAPDEGK